jgi:murein DD-endopeptidase MepM/ murein hydrolase activator NlpD
MKHKRTILFALATIALITSAPVWARIDDLEFEDLVQDEISKDTKLNDLNEEIQDKATSVRDLEERLYVYEENIKQKAVEQKNLENHLAILSDEIDSTKTEIEKKEIEIDVLQLEIEALQEQIRLTEENITKNKGQLTNVIRDMYNFEQKTSLEITLGNASLSDFFSDVEYTNRLQKNVQALLNRTQEMQQVLEEKRTEVKDKKAQVSEEKVDLEVDQQSLQAQEQNQQSLLEESEASEAKFEDLAERVQEEKNQIDGQILALERTAQEKINRIRAEIKQKLEDADTSNDALTNEEQEILDGAVTYQWPLVGKDRSDITCGFHCAGYPFAFAHGGIDIATGQGSPVYAAISGYITRAVSDGTTNLAWVLISGNDGIATAYLHLSQVSVSVDQYVFQGELIGYSGGMPGTPGAGAYTTGPHLHFEVLTDGIKVDPLGYLP